MAATMLGAYLPGGRRVELRDVPVPEPGPVQLLVEIRASTICGRDLRAIYHQHTGAGAEAYRDVIAGHEPAGVVVATGSDCRRITVGDRVALYHIAGCGVCDDCRAGYMVACTSPRRAAYGWQRDGGHAEYLVAEETTCVLLPDSLSFVDGACVACGFGTAYEALTRVGTSGADAVLVVGLGPVGLAAAMLARALGASLVVGAEPSEARADLARSLGLVDTVVLSGDGGVEAARSRTGGHGFEVVIECSGSTPGRHLAVAATRRRGRCALVGEGGSLELAVSPMVIHAQLTIVGSWVTSVGRMAELVER